MIQHSNSNGRVLGLEGLPELLGVLVHADHPEVVRLALAGLPGVAHLRPRVAKGTVQHAHRALGVYITRCSWKGKTFDCFGKTLEFEDNDSIKKKQGCIKCHIKI